MTNDLSPSLFDDLDEEASLGAATRKDAVASLPSDDRNHSNDAPWREVPQDIYLSWPWKKQMLYQAARDDAAAREADTAEEAAWHRARAALYREDVGRG